MIREMPADPIAELTELIEEDEPERAGAGATAGAAAVCLLVGVAGAVGAVGLTVGKPTSPGPGMWPLVLSVAIALLALVLLFTSRRYTDAERFTRTSLLSLAGAATLFAFWLALPAIGFEIPALVLMIVWLKWLGGESWRVTLPVALGTVIVLHLIFVEALSVPLPRLI